MCPIATTAVPKEEISDLDAVLAYHDGSTRAAIETLLKDCHDLRLQLARAQGAMSRGMTRGWSPRYEREDA